MRARGSVGTVYKKEVKLSVIVSPTYVNSINFL